MAISLDGLIGLNLVFLTIVLFLTIVRQWIFRHRPRTVASVVSDVSLMGFAGIIIVIGAFELKNTFEEKKLRRRFVDEKDVVRELVTEEYMGISFVCLVLYTTQLWLLKAAYLGYFVLLSTHYSARQILLLNTTIVYSLVTFVVAMTLQLTICLPISRNWSLDADACVGLSTVVGNTVQAWLNLSSDLLILLLAIITITALSLGREERFALFFVAALGSVSPLMCLLRFIAVFKAAKNPSDSGLDVLRNVYLWGKFEVCFEHIAFCLPALRVLWRRTAERSRCAKSSTSRQQDYGLGSAESGSEDTRKKARYLEEGGLGSQVALREGW